MALNLVEAQLKAAAESLKSELKGVSEIDIEPKYKSIESDTGGYYTIIATWRKRPDIQLWLDKAAGSDRHRFWFGFMSDSQTKVRNLIDPLPKTLQPRKKYTKGAWGKLANGDYVFKSPNKYDLERPFCELYPDWDEHFFGIYHWEGQSSSDAPPLDVSQAGTFIRGVVESATSKQPKAGKSADPEHRAKVEDAAIKRAKDYYKRRRYTVKSVESDNLGWDLEARRNGKVLLVEVKGLSGNAAVVEVTPNEYECMNKHKNTYRLCIVTNALSDSRAKLREFASDNNRRWWCADNKTLDIDERVAARIKVVT
jgi:hypothetical protein